MGGCLKLSGRVYFFKVNSFRQQLQVRSSVVLRVTAVQVPRTSMLVTRKRSRARQQTAQVGFSEEFGGDERRWSRLLGSIQGDGHVTKKGRRDCSSSTSKTKTKTIHSGQIWCWQAQAQAQTA